ncbi:RNA-binding S4 domain-containing protein [Sinorhizobium mexicanum]|uniref:RNA-binding S4 domain-containing protein n=1 Tax=Sinorhizobium mexicanum TaxID=375549 RepID=A0A859QF01_9HYPH|nr:RNA-binding S4 domain-containing protein [Sinorhizobium mexicanum]MBP1885605.1 ribosome-associated heat shock protein Hsp15 [Sinorhizobium mexicanum]QLL63582.1 RNA-binding S4 domain-containing protein [Sinorhizobium mexicanum]
MEKQPASAPASRQRLDKWLFFARLIKSRSLAQKAIEAGHVAVNGVRVTQSSAQVKTGDTLELSLERRDLVVRVLLAGVRRGPYEEARLLYEDLTPPTSSQRLTAFEQATRERGAGRPTKRERRDTDRLKSGFDEEDD